jgi:type IV pilus assembly protein PilB
MSFLEILVQKEVINRYQVDQVLEKLSANGGDLDKALVDAGISELVIRKQKSELFGIPERAVDPAAVPFDVFRFLNSDAARHYRAVPLGYDSPGVLLVGIVDPSNTETQNALQFLFSKSGTAYTTAVISLSDCNAVIERFSGLDNPQSESFDDSVTLTSFDNSPEQLDQELADKASQTLSAEKIVEDAPATKAVGVIISNAIEGGASDIHIEPSDSGTRVRYRVDGELHMSVMLPKNMHNSIIARIKVMAKMKLDERRKPLDGRFYGQYHGNKVDFRVSSIPTFFGEKMVIRILDQSRGVRDLASLGMRPDHDAMVRRALNRPYGIILMTGPTGSGKTSTLYSMLQEVDKEKNNVVSLEDPVEYNMAGVNQSQVMPEIGYTFAVGLRAILRQDPNVIMVGEIRDKETAQLAIQAALTGHLVLSTLHTNNAIGAIPRLVDMGVDPYLIPPVLNLVIAQRLTKKLPPAGPTKKIPVTGSMLEMVQNQFADLPPEFLSQLPLGDTLYDYDPSQPATTVGRAAVFEMIEMNRELEQIILSDPTEPTIYNYVRKHGMTSIKEDALLKSMAGIVPFSEVGGL